VHNKLLARTNVTEAWSPVGRNKRSVSGTGAPGTACGLIPAYHFPEATRHLLCTRGGRSACGSEGEDVRVLRTARPQSCQ